MFYLKFLQQFEIPCVHNVFSDFNCTQVLPIGFLGLGAFCVHNVFSIVLLCYLQAVWDFESFSVYTLYSLTSIVQLWCYLEAIGGHRYFKALKR